ncbi:MAG: hypothetical protein ABW167_15885, partial [Baekduia sp.]
MRILLGHRQASAVAMLVMLALALTAGPTASTARTTSTEHITLKLTKRTGKKKLTFTHTGRATGPVAGRVRAKSTLLSRVVWRGTMTIATKRGTLRLRIDARAQSLNRSSPFTGIATIRGGTGHYANARGVALFKAVLNRLTWRAT